MSGEGQSVGALNLLLGRCVNCGACICDDVGGSDCATDVPGTGLDTAADVLADPQPDSPGLGACLGTGAHHAAAAAVPSEPAGAGVRGVGGWLPHVSSSGVVVAC